jgi:hypothetical protein
VLLEVGDQGGPVGGPLLAAAEGVDLQLDVVKTEVIPQAGAHEDVLGIDVRPVVTHSLDTHLVKLAIAALLGALVAEHRAVIVQPTRIAEQQVVLDRPPARRKPCLPDAA